METKLYEIRDRVTAIAAIAIEVLATEADEHYLLRRAGYGVGQRYIILMDAHDTYRAYYDPYGWPDGTRTMPQAHFYIETNWDNLKSGDVIDVEFILGETEVPKVSERLTHG